MDESLICDLSEDSLQQIILNQDREYKNTHQKDIQWITKYHSLKKFKMDLLSKQGNMSPDEFRYLKESARSKGGFLTNDLRKDFYRIILNVESKSNRENFEHVYLNKEDTNVENPFIFKEEPHLNSKCFLICQRRTITIVP